MVFNALQINSYVFIEEIGANEKKFVWSTKGQHTVTGSVNSASITSLAIQRRRLGAGMQRLASAVPQLQHERGGA